MNETPVVTCDKKREEKEANERRVNQLVTAMSYKENDYVHEFYGSFLSLSYHQMRVLFLVSVF